MAKKVSPVTGQADYPGAGWLITSGFATEAYFQRFGDWHTGHDLAKSAAGGETIYAAADGAVKWAENAGDNGFGNLVYIEHSGSQYTRYGHLASISVTKGQQVTAGTPIGVLGKTGRATGPHLHFDISRSNNALDWPGKDKARVLQNYIDPTEWYAEATSVTVEPVVTQWLYVIAPAGLNVRKNPALSGKIDVKLPYGTAIQVTAVRLSKDGFDWRQLVTGGWIAEAYTQLTPPDIVITPVGERTEIVTTTISTTPAATPATVTVAARGVHANAGGWAPDDREIELVRHNGVESVLIPAYEANQAASAVQRFRDAGVRDFIARAATHQAITANPDDFINDTLPRLREYYQAVGPGLLLAVHNEPNITPEGWSTAWQNGVEFAQWYLRVVRAYRDALPGVRVGFPALSPGGDVPGLREDEWRFAAEAAGAIAASDWLGVHAYFVGEGDDLDLKPVLWQRMAQGRSIIVTEGGPADNIANNGAKLRNVYAKCAANGLPVMAWLLSGAGGWQSAGWKEQSVMI